LASDNTNVKGMPERTALSPRLRKVSRLAFGSLTLSPLQNGSDEQRSAEVIAYAFSRGINFIDTAQYYNNYNIIRRALKIYGAPDDIVISTKTYAYDRKGAESAVEQARTELDRDVIDIFMLHEQESYQTLRGHAEALDFLFECREKGIIKAVGMSTHHIAAVKGAVQLADEGTLLDVIHPIYNRYGIGIADGALYDDPVDQMTSELKKMSDRGTGIFCMKALAGGHLCSDAGEALRFVLSSGVMDCVALGMQSEEEIDANIHFFVNGSFCKSSIVRIVSGVI